MKLLRFSIYVFFLIIAFSCGKKEVVCELDSEILDQDLTLEIVRLEDEFFTAESKEDFEFLLEKYPDFAEGYLGKSLY